MNLGLASDVYINLCHWRPVDFSELSRNVEIWVWGEGNGGRTRIGGLKDVTEFEGTYFEFGFRIDFTVCFCRFGV